MDLTSSSNGVCKKYQFYTISLEISVITINIRINREVSDKDLLRTRYSCDVIAHFIAFFNFNDCTSITDALIHAFILIRVLRCGIY